MMATNKMLRLLGGLVLFALCGCDSGQRTAPTTAQLNAPPGPKQSKYTVEEAAKFRLQGSSPRGADSNVTPTVTEKPEEKPASPTPGAPAVDSNANRVKAEPGVGAASRDGGGGYLGQTFAAYFGAKEKIAFDQMNYALKNFRALEGHFPKSHAEFMEKIIKENQIKLPELPAGNVYQYDPKDGMLYVGAAPDK